MRESVSHYIARKFLIAKGWVTEDEIMAYIRNLPDESMISPRISSDPCDGRIPEVVEILRKWVHANVLGAKVAEAPPRYSFRVNDLDTIRSKASSEM
jgi:hypothetical protein